VDTAPTSHPSNLSPSYKDEMVEIYMGDSQDVLPSLRLNQLKVVHVVTDPPYGIGLEYGNRVDSWRPDRTYWKMLLDVLPNEASLHMTVSNKHLPFWIEEVTAAGWTYLHCSVYWNDGRAGGNWNGQFAYAWEPLVSFSKQPSGFRLEKRMLTDVFRHGGKRTTEHPAERDISAWSTFMSHLPGGMILDPFMGSGTTLRAALDIGRHAIGIEREEKWCNRAADRCSQMSLFYVS
jgi:DNA modification methylase